MRAAQHPAQRFRERLLGRLDLEPVGSLPRATPAYAAVLLALPMYADRDLLASPGAAELAAVTGADERTVKRATAWGIRAGLLERVGGGHRGRAATFRLIVPPKGDTSDPLSDEKGGQRGPERGTPVSPLLEELGSAAAQSAARDSETSPREPSESDPYGPWPSRPTEARKRLTTGVAS